MLARNYRFTAYNATTQTLASSAISVKARRFKFTSAGALSFETSETSVLSNGSTLANAAYVSGTGIDNSTDGYVGGDFLFTLVGPASSAGDVTIFYEVSTDGGTTWPANGQGVLACTITAVSSTTVARGFSL